VVKRRPAPHLTVASAPQILSPKRLRPTIEEHHQIELQQQIQQQAFNQIHNLSALPSTTAPIIDQSFLNQQQSALISSTLISSCNTTQTHLLAGISTTGATSATNLITTNTASTITNNTNNSLNMDNPMGQMTPMAPLGLSQSMDSVNTASNEEEVSLKRKENVFYNIFFSFPIVSCL
jgi:hypothetical protein